ncbi:Suppressor of the cold-sensitive snRNP bioproteinsis mutant brr1-1, partial [Perkinsus olseni]
ERATALRVQSELGNAVWALGWATGAIVRLVWLEVSEAATCPSSLDRRKRATALRVNEPSSSPYWAFKFFILVIMLLLVILDLAHLIPSRAEIADDRTIVSLSRISSSSRSLATSISPMVDVRSVPLMLATRLDCGRRLSPSERKVVDCLSNKPAVDTMLTLGVQVIDTGSILCNATRQEMCQYLSFDAETLE